MNILERLEYYFNQIPTTDPGICVCGSDVLVELHHLIPQSTGGTKWHEVPLCPTCHNKVHAQARVQMSKNQKTRSKSYLSAGDAYLQPIVNIAVLAKKLYNENESHWQHVAIKAITVEVSPAQLNRLHHLKSEQGFTSMDAFMNALIVTLTGLKAKPKNGQRE